MTNFKLLTSSISVVHNELQKQVANAINQKLTLRNWLIGYYIVEYQQNGKDRAEYGSKLLSTLAKEFLDKKGLDERAFRNFRLLYVNYPQIKNYLDTPESVEITQNLLSFPIRGTVTSISENQIRGSLSPELKPFKNKLNGSLILTKLSYSHLEQLIKINDDLKRTFYELECIKGTWSVRELKRQISSLYYERSGLSENPDKLSLITKQKIKPETPIDVIKDIYAFEFLDLDYKSVVEESDLEKALLDNLQHFILELGNGFCFESRQKRILIGENYYFIDLVFYHRILKCHIIVELKVGAFDHRGIGQLNTYLNYYKAEICETNDNPPVGILLVADKDHALVEYATAGMDQNIFVQQYLVNLPNKLVLEKYIKNELKKHK